MNDTGPPGKGEAALRHAATPKLRFNSPQDNSGVAIAQACAHKATVTQRLPDGHSWEICIQCGAFVRWLPKPETLERQRVNAFKLAKLVMHPYLTSWERQFLRRVSKLKKVSPKQLAVVDRLVRQYLEGAP